MFSNRPMVSTHCFGRVLLGNDSVDPAAWVHFIIQGDQVFVDHNRDNEPQQTEGFDVQNGLNLTVGERNFHIAKASAGLSPEAVSETLPQSLHLQVVVKDPAPYTMAGKLIMSPSYEECNWLQFGGELRFLATNEPNLRAGMSKPAELKIFIGTTTMGSPETGSIVQTGTTKKPDMLRTAIIIPEHQPPFPNLKIQFGEDSKSETIVMDHFC